MTDRNLPPEVEEALQEHEASLANHVLCPPAGECSDRCMDGWTTARAALRSAFLAALDQADEERSTAVAEAAEATFRARAAEAALSEAATMLERASGSATAPGEVLIYAQAAARARAVLAVEGTTSRFAEGAMKPNNEYRVEGGRRVSWRVVYKEQLTDGAWRVIFDGTLTTPRFQHEGAARAYLAALINGERKPEF